jgi:hypothetical protein
MNKKEKMLEDEIKRLKDKISSIFYSSIVISINHSITDIEIKQNMLNKDEIDKRIKKILRDSISDKLSGVKVDKKIDGNKNHIYNIDLCLIDRNRLFELKKIRTDYKVTDIKKINNLQSKLDEVINAITSGQVIKDKRGKVYKQEFGETFIKHLKK